MPYKPIHAIKSPEIRAKELPDEFIVKSKKLYCKWCEKTVNSLRKDNLNEHLHSRIHQDNRMKNGAPMSYDPDSPKRLQRRLLKKRAQARKKERLQSEREGTKKKRLFRKQRKTLTSDDESEDSSESSSDSSSGSSSEEDLSQIFEQSDGDDTESFQGFGDKSTSKSPKNSKQPTRRGRPPKRPHLDDSGNMGRSRQSNHSPNQPLTKKRRRDSSTDNSSPSIPLRSMPLKKQMSYKARSSLSTPSSVTGSLKIRIKRRSDRNSNSYQDESSDLDKSDDDDGQQVTSYKQDGLKMKFVLNKEHSPHKLNKKVKKEESPYDQSYMEDVPLPIRNLEQDMMYDQSVPLGDVTFHGVEEVIGGDGMVDSGGIEVVEEEIVGVDDGEVVSWDAVARDEEILEEEVEVPLEQDIDEAELRSITSEKNLAMKANYAREMARAVNSAQFRKKKSVPKKLEAKLEEKDKKRKATGYMLWSSKMRKQVSTQFPGLQFGDVSKKLGDLWKRIPDKEKQMWKYRSVKMADELEKMQSASSTKRSKGSKMIETGPKKKIVSPKKMPFSAPLLAQPPHKNPEQIMLRELQKLPTPSLEPIDAAAHLNLLGQSLTNIGNQVRNSVHTTSVNAVLPLLLDSLVCSFAPLISLVNQVPQLNGAVPDSIMSNTLANIAHLMPGI